MSLEFDYESLRKYEYFRCCLLVEGLISNAIVLGIFFVQKNMRTSVNYFEVNLSIAQIVFTIVSFSTSVRMIRRESVYSDMIAEQFSSGATVSVLLFTIIAISIHRYKLIQNPSKFEANPRTVLYGICAIWFIALVSNAVSVTLYHFYLMQAYGPTLSKIYLWIFITMGTGITFLPLIAIAVFYAILSSQSMRYGAVGQQPSQNANNIWTRKNEIKIMLITVALFAVSWLPHIFYFFQFVLTQFGVEVPLQYFLLWPGGSICRTILILPVVCLPIMHYFTSSGYRSGFNKLCAVCLRAITCGHYKIPATHNRR